MNIKDILKSYATLAIVAYLIISVLRLLETSLIFFNYKFSASVMVSESIGLGFDILFVNLFLIVYLPIYYFTYKVNKKTSNLLFLFVLGIITLLSFMVFKYFLYQLIPLDISLYKYSFQEVFFTIKTSNISITAFFLASLFLVVSIIVCYTFANKIRYSKLLYQLLIALSVISIPLLIVLHYSFFKNTNNYTQNKLVYFIGKSLNYFVNPSSNLDSDWNANTTEFSALYANKNFIDSVYPLAYKIDRKNLLGNYFNKFDSPPNIVILIIEGLNDDFIHEYKDTQLMPFLSKLKDKSLYWKKCFTLGERSFAVVPSILGGLPYGEKGFTLLDKLPRHLSLVSVLNSNNYHTSFFYGQGAWFHQKKRFFNYNDADLVFDDSKFSQHYEKIIVGDDDFFWGYNDKDLFNQYFEIIDTIKDTQRLDIFFTGTSHSPFRINNDKFYTEKLKKHSNKQNQDFFTTYEKYLKTILFVDDALKDFFDNYKKRDDYENTIFIITGDHPMTELPRSNSLKRYHVPLIIYSEKLKENATFANVVSHLDVSESIISLLNDYVPNIPSITTSLGDNLLTDTSQQTKRFAFMNDNREVIDYYSNGYYLSENNLFKVDSLLNIQAIENDSLLLKLKNELIVFNKVSLSASLNNKIISADLYCQALNRINVYSQHSTDTLSNNFEYNNLTPAIEIANHDFIFDISMNTMAIADKDLVVVYQLTNSKDSILLWNNIGISNEKAFVQAHIKINKQMVSDSTFWFKSYIWNQNKTKIRITDLDILIHQEKPKN